MDAEEFGGWRENPLTQDVFRHLQKRRVALNEAILNVIGTQVDRNDPCFIRTVHVAGIIAGINELLELTYEDMEMRE